MLPSISVVTPSLNQGKFIERTLLSVRQQTYPACEHIVIDGGSTDETGAILAAHQEDVHLIVDESAGQSTALNLGFRLARGDVIGWLNSDDMYFPWTLDTVASSFHSHPEAAVVYGDCEVIDSADTLKWVERPGAGAERRLLVRGNQLSQPAVFFRREALSRVGYLDETLHFAMDFELWLRLARRYELVYEPRPLARYRWRAGSKTGSGVSEQWRETLHVIRLHGGHWTARLLLAYARARFTQQRQRLVRRNRDPAP